MRREGEAEEDRESDHGLGLGRCLALTGRSDRPGAAVERRVRSGVDEEIVDASASESTRERAKNRSPDPVLIPERPHLASVEDRGHEPRSKVPCGVHGEGGLHAERRRDAEEDEEDDDGEESGGRRAVPLIGDGEEDEQEDGCCQELAEERVDIAHVLEGICAEETSSARDSKLAAFEQMNGTTVISVDDESTEERAGDLGKDVDWELPEGEATEDDLGEGDRRVDMAAGDPRRDPDATGKADTPS